MMMMLHRGPGINAFPRHIARIIHFVAFLSGGHSYSEIRAIFLTSPQIGSVLQEHCTVEVSEKYR
jgi:hypothetical protein